jgi:hypothetical protein
MNKIFLVLVLMLSLSLIAQNEKPFRSAYKLEIAANETQQYAMDVQESPYFVKEKILQIYCGEKIFIECETQADTIIKMMVVEKNTHPEKTIEIDLNQNTENRKEIYTKLWVKNPFAKTLRYDVLMFTPLSQKWKSTSILPIMPNLQNFETWPHSIITLVLQNWKLE